EISLFDPSGRKLKDFTHNTNADKVVIEKGNLKKGIYLLLIQTEKYISKSKLIIE
ncbi:MAG: T9SS type A sorting domain-containing protein, partial [Flavobacteriales bacterium]|nr:T9SS type A sorting domain-containing protein [Flavobacteriales bacterium]